LQRRPVRHAGAFRERDHRHRHHGRRRAHPGGRRAARAGGAEPELRPRPVRVRGRRRRRDRGRDPRPAGPRRALARARLDERARGVGRTERARRAGARGCLRGARPSRRRRAAHAGGAAAVSFVPAGPHARRDRAARPLAHAIAAAVAFAGAAVATLAGSPARAQTVAPDFYITNGQVNAQFVRGNPLYIGGTFNFVGPVTGSGVPVDTSTAAPAAGYPRVNGTVMAVVPDGSGGWYIGGQFTAVGASAR